MSLAGKTLFITGASRGIGLAIALRAARDGANIAVAAKTAAPHPKLRGTIHTAAADIERAGGRALPLAVDVRDEAAVAAAVRQCAETFGGIDICVNNASAINLAPTERIEMRRYDLIQQINTRGTFVTTRACLPYLKQAANPHVLTLSPPLSQARDRGGRRLPDPQPAGARVQRQLLHRRQPAIRSRGARLRPLQRRAGHPAPGRSVRSARCAGAARRRGAVHGRAAM